MSKQVEVIEVGPRDGFQSVKCTPITTEQKLTVIDQLVAAGVKHIEYTSFVSPKAIPQLADIAKSDCNVFCCVQCWRNIQTWICSH